MIKSKLLRTLLTCAAIGCAAPSAHASTYEVTINWWPNVFAQKETFDININQGQADGVSSDYVLYNITNDNLGNTGIFFGDSSQGNWVGTGSVQPYAGGGQYVVQTNSDYFDTPLFNPSKGLMALIAPGQTYTASNNFGSTMTVTSVSAVPEPSTWAMMLAGFAGLALVGRRRRKTAIA